MLFGVGFSVTRWLSSSHKKFIRSLFACDIQWE